MNRNQLISGGVILVVILAATFYGGMRYGYSQASKDNPAPSGGGFAGRNFPGGGGGVGGNSALRQELRTASPEQRQQLLQQLRNGQGQSDTQVAPTATPDTGAGTDTQVQ